VPLVIAGLAAGSGIGMEVAAQGQAPATTLAIARVAVIDVDAGIIRPDLTVLIRDGHILDVGRDVRIPDGAEIVDGTGKFLLPGLWDMHVHLSYARASALPVLAANGVTGVRDMGGALAELDRWNSKVTDGLLVGPVILRSGPALNRQEASIHHLAVENAEQARTAVRTLHKVGVDFIKVYRGLPRDAFVAVAEEAARLGLQFGGHVPESVSPAEASDAGLASVEHMETLFEGTFATEHAGENQAVAIAHWRTTEAERLFALFKANGTMVTPTLVANSQVLKLLQTTALDSRTRYIARSAREEAQRTLSGLRPTAAQMLDEFGPILREQQSVAALLSRVGVRLLAGTDLSFLHVPGFSLHDELALMVDSGIPIVEALRSATVNPAAVLRLPDAGKVAAGMRADLVLLTANPLEDIRNTQRIDAVVLRGRYMGRERLNQVLEEAALLADAN
jgi:imidazolonepropionase-like amidohydrolase